MNKGTVSASLLDVGGLLCTAGALTSQPQVPRPCAHFGYRKAFHVYVCIAAACLYVLITLCTAWADAACQPSPGPGNHVEGGYLHMRRASARAGLTRRDASWWRAAHTSAPPEDRRSSRRHQRRRSRLAHNARRCNVREGTRTFGAAQRSRQTRGLATARQFRLALDTRQVGTVFSRLGFGWLPGLANLTTAFVLTRQGILLAGRIGNWNRGAPRRGIRVLGF